MILFEGTIKSTQSYKSAKLNAAKNDSIFQKTNWHKKLLKQLKSSQNEQTRFT